MTDGRRRAASALLTLCVAVLGGTVLSAGPSSAEPSMSHVGIYVGDGQIVHAANPSTGFAVAPVGSMPVSGAVRPG